MATTKDSKSDEYTPVRPEAEPKAPEPVKGDINVVSDTWELTGEHFTPEPPDFFPWRYAHRNGKVYEQVKVEDEIHYYKVGLSV